LWRRLTWVALLVVVGVSLAIGAPRRAGPATAAQRAAAIDATLRCPSCDDISVANSSASTAVAIRRVVAAEVRQGWSEARIDAFLEDRYGPGILLRPPTHGATVWVWVLPPVAVVAAAGGLAAVFWRRRSAAEAPASPEDSALVARALSARARGSAPATGPAPDR
jgi:cytochrome c-type biogenesis protein CcmH